MARGNLTFNQVTDVDLQSATLLGANFNWQGSGETDGSVAYRTGDIVVHSDSLWVALRDNDDSEPVMGSADWEQVGASTISRSDHFQAAATEPTTGPDGSALEEGDLWYDTTNNRLNEYDGTSFSQVRGSQYSQELAHSGGRMMTIKTTATGTDFNTYVFNNDINVEEVAYPVALIGNPTTGTPNGPGTFAFTVPAADDGGLTIPAGTYAVWLERGNGPNQLLDSYYVFSFGGGDAAPESRSGGIIGGSRNWRPLNDAAEDVDYGNVYLLRMGAPINIRHFQDFAQIGTGDDARALRRITLTNNGTR